MNEASPPTVTVVADCGGGHLERRHSRSDETGDRHQPTTTTTRSTDRTMLVIRMRRCLLSSSDERTRSECELSHEGSSTKDEMSPRSSVFSNPSPLAVLASKRPKRRLRPKQPVSTTSSLAIVAPPHASLEVRHQHQAAAADCALLNPEQTGKLQGILMQRVMMKLVRNHPARCQFSLVELLRTLSSKLRGRFGSIRLNGGAASYVLSSRALLHPFNDVDLIIDGMSEGSDKLRDEDWEDAMDAIKSSLLEFAGSPPDIASIRLKRLYCISNLIKIDSADSWALITLDPCAPDQNPADWVDWGTRKIELKFVHKIKRQFQFSVDSFQIELSNQTIERIWQCRAEQRRCAPSLAVEVKCMYGNIDHALRHLNHRLIATYNPEEIRGGGLLKYCELLTRDYLPANHRALFQHERCMCTRFFIDFPMINEQENNIASYIETHFETRLFLIRRFLEFVHNVINRNAVCLMNQERQTVLCRIRMAAEVFPADMNTYLAPPFQQLMLGPILFPPPPTQQQPSSSILPHRMKLVMNSLAYKNTIPVASSIQVFRHSKSSTSSSSDGGGSRGTTTTTTPANTPPIGS